MRRLIGVPQNITKETLGTITFKRKFFSKKKYIHVSASGATPKGYLAILTDDERKPNTQPLVANIKNLSELNEGDVVLINPDGSVNVFYERKSNHNALMVTECCNHRCIMCPQPLLAKENSKTEFNLKLISLFDKKTARIGITGGEPTMIGDDLFRIIAYIRQRMPKAAVSLLSNGVRFSDYSFAKKLAEARPLDFQIDIPIFSDVDSEHDKVVGAGTFYQTVEGLYNLASLRLRIGLRIVIHKQTYKRLPRLAEFIYRNFPFVCNVAFMQMETNGLSCKSLDSLWIDPFDYNDQLEEAVLSLHQRNMNVSIYNAQLCVLPRTLWKFAYQSISDWKRIFLPVCHDCRKKEQCAGFFASAENLHSNHINNINTERR
jgi:His-Xaa-Ser system radical SAM maturase HxsC